MKQCFNRSIAGPSSHRWTRARKTLSLIALICVYDPRPQTPPPPRCRATRAIAAAGLCRNLPTYPLDLASRSLAFCLSHPPLNNDWLHLPERWRKAYPTMHTCTRSYSWNRPHLQGMLRFDERDEARLLKKREHTQTRSPDPHRW